MKLISARVGCRPVRFDMETIGVEVAWNVAGASWVAVMPPCASNVIGLFEEGEILVAEPTLELDCHAES